MIFSSAHTDTQDRRVSTNTSITHFCPSWFNIIDIQAVVVEGGAGGEREREGEGGVSVCLSGIGLLLLQEKKPYLLRS